MQSQKKILGFTLLEMVIVLGIFSILLTMAMPNLMPIRVRSQVREAIELVNELKPQVKAFYLSNDYIFPGSNAIADLPEPSKLINHRVMKVELDNGAFHIFFGNTVAYPLQGKVLTIQPLVVSGSPESPINWRCGFQDIPNGMEAVGYNATTIEVTYLPLECRKLK